MYITFLGILFETDIYQGQKIMSGMISDLPSDWRTKLDERIVSQANTLSQQNYSIFRGYINAWKCDEVSLPHMMVIILLV